MKSNFVANFVATTDTSQSGSTGIFSSLFPPEDLTYLQPQRLWWLSAIAVLLIAYIGFQFLRSRAAFRFTNVELLDKIAPERLGWTRHIPLVFFLNALALSTLAYAEPAATSEVPSEKATVMLAIDTSLSMMATDVKPDRIRGAQEAAIDFLEDIPPEINVGLVSFNGIATVRVPPTQNRASVRSAIADLELGEATAIGEALLACVQALESFIKEFDGNAPPARIVLMSDGSTTVGRPDTQGIEAARLAGISVSTISFGTDRGTVQLDAGSVIPVPVDSEALKTIAKDTGGQFFEAATTAQLKEIYADIGSSIATEPARVLVGSWFSGRAIILMIMAGAASLYFTNRLP